MYTLLVPPQPKLGFLVLDSVISFLKHHMKDLFRLTDSLYMTSTCKFHTVMPNKLHICTYVAAIWKSVRTLFSKSTHICLFPLAFVWNIKCQAHIEPVYIPESYSAHSISIQLCYLQPSLLVIPSSKVRREKNVHIGSLLSKRKRKTKHWEHLDSRKAITEASHCFFASRLHSCHWPAHKSRVISVPPRSETLPVYSLMQKGKKRKK